MRGSWSRRRCVSCFKCFADRMDAIPNSGPRSRFRPDEQSLKHLKHKTPTFRDRRNRKSATNAVVVRLTRVGFQRKFCRLPSGAGHLIGSLEVF